MSRNPSANHPAGFRHGSIELTSRRTTNSMDELHERQAASDAGSPIPLLSYHQSPGAPSHGYTAQAIGNDSRRSSMLGRLLPSTYTRSLRPASGLEVELELDTTIEKDSDKYLSDAKPHSAQTASKGLALDTDTDDKDVLNEKVIDVDPDAVERDISILDTIRAQRRQTRRRWITAAAVVFCVLLTTGAIYGAVVDATWKKYQNKMTKSSSSSSSSSSDDQEDIRVNGGRGINATALRGVQRIWAHSHNDEMQGVPLATALSNGFGSIEIDVWLSNPSASPSTLTDDLWIGHEPKDLPRTPTSSLNTVYLDPLLELLDTNNAARSVSSTSWVGVYTSDPNATVQLVFDIKDYPMETYMQIQKALAVFKDKGYLTTYDMEAEKWTIGPLTIIGTGNTPIEAVYYAARASNSTSSTSLDNTTTNTTNIVSSKERYIFFDAPLHSLHLPYSVPASSLGPAIPSAQWTASIAPMASSKFPVPFNAAAFLPPPPANIVLPHLRWYADQAASKGIRARWWGAARRPGFVRGRLWALMLDAGNVWIGADDLRDARRVLQG